MPARLSCFSLLSGGVFFSAVEGVGQQMTNVVLVFSHQNTPFRLSRGRLCLYVLAQFPMFSLSLAMISRR